MVWWTTELESKPETEPASCLYLATWCRRRLPGYMVPEPGQNEMAQQHRLEILRNINRARCNTEAEIDKGFLIVHYSMYMYCSYVYWQKKKKNLRYEFGGLIKGALNFFFFSRFTAHLGLGFFILNLYSITVWSAAPQTSLWGGPGPRIKPGTGDPEARTLTTRPSQLLEL